ncbi:Hypothetical predicted protein [Pelobates cultripes]|uniref:Uncharacterized protein n=1 Tax=Pelobates cultripes TaxID=61616 RepID=A0AAD1S0S2_PELCU|nr:Hypothetical predicted protein [Pelobates cultripes]
MADVPSPRGKQQLPAEQDRCAMIDRMLQQLDKLFARFWRWLEVRAKAAAGGQKTKRRRTEEGLRKTPSGTTTQTPSPPRQRADKVSHQK